MTECELVTVEVVTPPTGLVTVEVADQPASNLELDV